jgi:hypothetical protein
MKRQRGDVQNDAVFHDSSSGVPFGQNQPIKAIATGIDPQITAQGEKIDQISMIEVAIADQNGQTESRGEDSLASGKASTTLVTKSSRRSVRKPAAVERSLTSSDSGFRERTTGMRLKLYGGGGEVVAHSSVEAPQGFGPAAGPDRKLRRASMKKTTKPNANMIELKLTNRFKPLHGNSG